MSFMGVDIGTTGCKALVVDATGARLALAYRDYPLIAEEAGWAELDSERVMSCCLEVMGEAASLGGEDRVRGVGVSSQGEAFTAVDSNGACLMRGMVSSDLRSVPYAKNWARDFGMERLYEITGHTPHPMFTVFKLLWLKEHRPEIWRQADRFLCYEDLLALRLGVEPALGWPLAGRTMLFDVRKHAWSTAILEEVGLEPDRLARPLASGSVSGEIPDSVCAELGLSDGCVLVTGGHDQPCAGLGGGAVADGVAMYTMGTVECMTPAFGKAVLDAKLMQSNLCTYDHVAEGMYATVAFSLTGGNALQWFRDQFGGGMDYEALLACLPEEATDLMFLPYLTPSGTPHFDVDTPGAVTGLRLGTSRGTLLKALLEGVALEMRLNLDILREAGVEVQELRAVGGGAKSPELMQMKADVLGHPIIQLEVAEAGCLGVAMLACAAVSGRNRNKLAAEWVRSSRVFEPCAKKAGVYGEKLERYREWHGCVRDFIKPG